MRENLTVIEPMTKQHVILTDERGQRATLRPEGPLTTECRLSNPVLLEDVSTRNMR